MEMISGEAQDYALVAPDNTIDRIESLATIGPSVATKGGFRWLPMETVNSPADPDREVKEGPFFSVEKTRVVRAWNVRDMNERELSARKDAKVASLDSVLLAVLLDQENRLRVLEGRASVTIAQFQDEIKSAA
jgi:hypothetical protein